MATVRINIECTNAATQNIYDVAELLERVADRMHAGTESGVILDTNGNTVGAFDTAGDWPTVSPEEEK